MHRDSKAADHPIRNEKPVPRKTERKPAATRRTPPLTSQQEDVVLQFAPHARRGLRKLIRENKRYFDLATVFPAAAYALATPYRPASQRKAVARMVVEGSPLKHVAKALDLPMWLRRLPANAFTGDLLGVPGSESFSRRIANRIPTGRDATSFWLEAVCFNANAAGEDFALWVATKRIHAKPGEAQLLFATLAAYAWHSRNANNRANSLIAVPWHPEIAFDTALCAAKSWLNRLRLVMQLEKGAIDDPWMEAGEVNGFTFTPLLDHVDLLGEARAMQNCSDQYASPLARDRCRLFSITRRGLHVATMEIAPHPRETGILTIMQLKGRHNMPASLAIWQAAHAWLARQAGLKRVTTKVTKDLPLNKATWDALINDYRKQKNGAPWLPDDPASVAFQKLESALADLARRAGVRSWLFTGA